MNHSKNRLLVLVFWSLVFLCLSGFEIKAQEQPPAPSAPKPVSVPAVKEKRLPNGLTVAVAERKNVPLVTVQLLIRSGASSEDLEKAGLANMTANLLTKGTKTRTATQIAEQMEYLGGSITTGADWNKSIVTISVMSDKLDQAMAIMADVVLNPTFKQDEIDLLKSQTLDGLAYNLKQPGFLSNYVANVYSFDEHPSGGTPESIKNISRKDIVNFKRQSYGAADSVLIFTGDISPARAFILSRKFFGSLGKPIGALRTEIIQRIDESPSVKSNEAAETQIPVISRILVVDLANSGQTSVSYTSNINYGRGDYDDEGRYDVDRNYFPALVLNSILGGGYSSRLNQEIRIKRGLSYGAGSSFAWRGWKTNFATRTQTKDVSGAEVAELVLAEVKKLSESSATAGELISRKSVLTGNFGRNLETNEGLAAAIADLYSFGLPTKELNSYTYNVQTVSDSQIRDYAKKTLVNGDIIIVGDYAKFKDDLAKRFPSMSIEVVKADELDLSKENLRK
jgi:zinc protease